MSKDHKISHRIKNVIVRPSRRGIAVPFERETNWRFYELRIKEIIGRNENVAYQLCITLAEAKAELDKLAFLKLIDATYPDINRRITGYSKSTVNKWVQVGADKRLKDPRISQLLPLEIWRLYALHKIEDPDAFQVALQNGLGVREMDALRRQPDDSGLPVHRDLGDFEANRVYHMDCFDAFKQLEEVESSVRLHHHRPADWKNEKALRCGRSSARVLDAL
jgi:hypothetical protein